MIYFAVVIVLFALISWAVGLDVVIVRTACVLGIACGIALVIKGFREGE